MEIARAIALGSLDAITDEERRASLEGLIERRAPEPPEPLGGLNRTQRRQLEAHHRKTAGKESRDVARAKARAKRKRVSA